MSIKSKAESPEDLRQAELTVRELTIGRRLSNLIPPSTMGLAGGFIGYVISIQPSLLPRTWQWQSIVSGILVTVAYAMGLVISAGLAWLWRSAAVEVSASRAWVKWGSRILVAVAFGWILAMFWRAYRLNSSVALLTGMEPLSIPGYGLAAVAAVVFFSTAYGIWLGIRKLWQFIASHARRIVPAWVATPIATLIVIALVVFISSDVIFRGSMEYMYSWGARLNDSDSGAQQPLVGQRSGSPQSLVKWDEIGHYGQRFLGNGPSATQISEVTGRPALEPIRIYAPIDKARNLQAAANLVVAELERTGAFDRDVLVLATTTGTGWLEEWSLQPVEYLTGGNCAIASMQYSYVPSIVAFLWEFDSSAKAGTILYETVKAALDKRSSSKRPALYLTGVSLGAAGSQAPFTRLNEVLEGVDGAVWAGTPNYSPLWQRLTSQRHRGTPQVAPVVDNADNVRFANKPSQLQVDINGRNLPPWQFPRVVFLQHPSDPVVWWSPELFSTEPDWLRERVGEDVDPRLRWLRGITGLKVLADLPVSGDTPDGHGHIYHREFIDTWIEVLGLEGAGSASGNAYREADGSWISGDTHSEISERIAADIYGQN